MREHFNFLKSMRLRLFLIVLVLSILPMSIVDRVLLSSAEDKLVQNRIYELQYQCNTLSKQMAKSGYMEAANNNALNAEISLLSDVYDGRIMVINQAFEIIRDTYNSAEGKINISNQVLSCFKGENSYKFHKNQQYAEFTMPIYDANLQNVAGALVVSTSTSSIGDWMDSYHTMARIVELAVLIVLSVIAFFLADIIIRPLKKTVNAINKAADGDLSPIEVNDYLETQSIAQAYNQTLTRLKTLDETRQEFVSNVSHELKTPITSIRVLADSLMSMEEVPVELYREFLQDISDEIDRESTIIEDLLTLVRLDKSATELHVKQVNINDLLERILKRLRPIAQKQNIEIVFESFRPVVADIDEVKLTLAITNLIENSIKYNKEDGWIRVSLNADHKFFYIKVQDSGLGIPEEAQQHVFERFYRVDKARSRESGGTGLGLAITKSVIQLHHGAIKLYSKEGEGTTFTVRIPLIYIS